MAEHAAVSAAILKDASIEQRGHVRVTSVGFVLAHALAPALGALAQDHPGVRVEFLAEDRNLNFERREADVAVRLGPSAEHSTRVRKLGEIGFRLRRPASVVADHPHGFMNSMRFPRCARSMGRGRWQGSRSDRTDSRF
jgi:DNA-binding transcriptional LysR family regulator